MTATASQIDWAKSMRLMFSPQGMCSEDGAIRQDFFKPAKVRFATRLGLQFASPGSVARVSWLAAQNGIAAPRWRRSSTPWHLPSDRSWL